jgi:sugar phosphate isomerase/epimerase
MKMTALASGMMSCLTAAAGLAGESAFFAMDTGTRDAQHQTIPQQVALVKELGFDGLSPAYSTPDALAETLRELDRHQLAVFPVYVGLELDAEPPVSPAIREVVRQLRGRDAMIWLYVRSAHHKPSDAAADELAVPLLREISGMADEAGLRVALYPHKDFWIERTEDAVRVAKQVDHPSLGVTFNLCHWLMVDGRDLDATLTAARPHLMAVTINGADEGAKDWARLIQPLDRGDFKVGRVLAKLDELGWRGPVGLQHYGIGGDAKANLRRSMDAWRKLRDDAAR